MKHKLNNLNSYVFRAYNFRTLRVIFLFLAVAGIAVPIFIYYRHSASAPADNNKNISHYQQPYRPRHAIRGFSFDSSHDGRRLISIKADRFSIKKKKLGFLSFGLINEVIIDNAIIHIYGRSELPEKRSDEKRTNRSTTDIQSQRHLTFKGIFSKNALPSFQAKKISSIVMKPVCVELHDEKSVVTQISAASAVVRLKKRYILFKGNVRVVSESRVLTTSRLKLFPEKAVILCDQHFILKTSEKDLEGNRLTSDIFLK
ncbi:MAG: hypothetical protein LWW98_08370 [Deltaproteobacteria bacterium]|nr:hypothetical protein [Deltaproteobacteria bacterium]